jgi:Uma2 family endonuclease
MAMPHDDPIRPLRRAEYDQLIALGAFEDERIELLEGQLVEMPPIGPPHSSAVQKLTALLVPALIGRATVRVQSPFAASETSEPEPDLVVTPLGDYDTAHPTNAYWVIEVAESSLRKDRLLKQRIYAKAGVSEYWIVNTREKCIEVYRDPEPDGYATKQRVDHASSVAPRQFPDLVIAVESVMK